VHIRWIFESVELNPFKTDLLSIIQQSVVTAPLDLYSLIEQSLCSEILYTTFTIAVKRTVRT